jgi:hypothetical protein
MEELKKIYYDPKQGLQSVEKIYNKVKHLGLKKSEVKNFIESQTVNQVLTIPKKKIVYNSYKANYERHIYQIDIMVYDRYEYHNYKYILVVIDIYSRYANARAMTNRQMKTIIKNYKSIINDMGSPYLLQADNEFNKKEFKNVLDEDNTRYKFFEANEINKNAIVERFNGTLATLLQKIRLTTNRYDWYNYLADAIYNYNNTIHSTIKKTPDEIFNGGEFNEQEYEIVENPFKIGDLVRIIVKKKVFDKGDNLKLSADAYIITDIDNQRITLDSVKKKYKPYQLYKVKKSEDFITKPKTEIRNKKIRNEFKRLDIEPTNILESKRTKKSKTVNDDYLYY